MRYLTVLVIGSLLAGLPAAATADAPRNPEDILESLETAYAAGDVEALRALMAPEYEYVSKGGAAIPAELELKALRRLFDVARVTLTFSRDFELRRTDAGKESWVLRSIPTHVRVAENAGSTWELDTGTTLFLRRDPGSGGVWIFRWRDEEAKADD